MAERLITIVLDSGYQPERVVWSEFDAYSSRESSRKLAHALDEALDRFKKSRADRGVNM